MELPHGFHRVGLSVSVRVQVVIRVTCHPRGHRLHILGLRVHHYHAAIASIAIGIYLLARDWPDFTDAVHSWKAH